MQFYCQNTIRHAWRYIFTCNVIYCKNNIKCDSASNAPICPLNNDVSIIQKHVVKLRVILFLPVCKEIKYM